MVRIEHHVPLSFMYLTVGSFALSVHIASSLLK